MSDKKSFTKIVLGFLAIGLVAGIAWAETTEIVTYYPTSGGGGADPQVNSIRVGNGYAGTAAPGNGIARIETSLGIGLAGLPTQQIEITGNFQLPATTAPGGILAGGAILSNGNRFIHNFGSNNFFAGVNAGNFTMTGGTNTAVGATALRANTTGGGNTAVGQSALASNTTGPSNTAIGIAALTANISGGNNVAIGRTALFLNNNGSFNTAVGNQSLANNTVSDNTAIGFGAMQLNTTGTDNTAVGFSALLSNTTGVTNAAVGMNTLLNNTIGGGNAALGTSALLSNTTGINNTAVGSAAGGINTTGSNNVFIGQIAQPTVGNLTNAIAIGSNAQVGASNSMVLGGTGANAVNVGIAVTTPRTPAPNAAAGNLDVNDVWVRSLNAGAGAWLSQQAGGGAQMVTGSYVGNGINARRTIAVAGVTAATPIRFLTVIGNWRNTTSAMTNIKTATMAGTLNYHWAPALATYELTVGGPAIQFEATGFSFLHDAGTINQNGQTYHYIAYL